MALHADRGLCRPLQATPDAEWWVSFHRKFSYEKINKSNPYFGGYNPLHLIHFHKLWDEPAYTCEPDKLGATSMRAILTLPDPQGWYTSLSVSCKELGMLGYTIDVVIKDLGWFGSFRHSPITGLWYQGEHYIHLEGNLHPKVDGIQPWRDVDFFSKYDQRTISPEAKSFMDKKGYRTAVFDDSIDFQLPLASRYFSKEGKPRTILGYGFNAESVPVYIIRLDDMGDMDIKRTYKAHQEYGNQVGYDYEVWQKSLKGEL
jgi:hypothetical protein